jgi:hypothetical protein
VNPGLARALALGLGLIGLVLSCEYVPEPSLPMVAQKLAILPLEDKVGNPALSQLLSEKVTQDFVAGGRLTVVSSTAEADLALRWTLQRYDEIIMLRDSNLQPVRYRLQLMVDVDLLDPRTGKVRLTTRRTVDLTPQPSPDAGEAAEAVGDEDSLSSTSGVAEWDSEEIRTLKEFTSHTVGNSMGLPSEDEFTPQQRLTEQMARRVVRLVVTGSFAPSKSGQPTPVPTPHRHRHHPQGAAQ